MKSILLMNTLYYPNIGGVENSLWQLSRQAANHDFFPVILASTLNNVNKQKLKEQERFNTYCIYRYNSNYFPLTPLVRIFNAAKLARRISKIYPFEFVISRSAETTIAARLAGLKNIYYIPPALSKEQKAANNTTTMTLTKKIPFEHHLQIMATRLSNRNITFSNSMLKGIKKLSDRKNKTTLIRPGVDTETFSCPTAKDKDQVRKHLKLPISKTIYLCMGRLVPLKNFDLAIEMSEYLRVSEHVIIVGAGPEKNHLQDLIASRNLEHKVSLINSTFAPEDYYKAADAYLMLSSYESFGQTLLEATASGLPIIALHPESGVNTATQDIFDDYPDLVQWSYTTNPTELAQAAQNSLKNKNTKFQSQKTQFLAEYSWPKTFEQILNLDNNCSTLA